MPIEKKVWQGHHVLHDQHIPELERAAALHEFSGGSSKQEAEAKAYQDYRKEQHEKAAAHHLRGLKASYGSGDREDAKKHAVLYELHMKKLGHEPWKPPPPEIELHVNNEAKERMHKFKPTGADAFVLDEHESVKKSLERIYDKALKAIEILKKS